MFQVKGEWEVLFRVHVRVFPLGSACRPNRSDVCGFPSPTSQIYKPVLGE